MIRKLSALILVLALVVVGLVGTIAPVAATTVNLIVNCRYQLSQNPGVWRDCDNVWSNTPVVHITDISVDTYKSLVPSSTTAVPINSTANVTMLGGGGANTWFFGCTPSYYHYDNIVIGTENRYITFSYTCSTGYVYTTSRWHQVGWGGDYYPTTVDTLWLFTPSSGSEHMCSGDIWNESDYTVCEEYDAAGTWTIQTALPPIDTFVHPECWTYVFATHTISLNQAPDWTQHVFTGQTFYRYSSPDYCLDLP